MRQLDNTEICEASGGVFGFFTGLIMGSLDYRTKPTVIASSAVECIAYSSGYVTYFLPGVIIAAPHLATAALVGAGLGYIGHELAQAL